MSLFTLTIGTHFFRANALSPRARDAVVEFARKFVKFTLKVDRNRYIQNGTMERVMEAVFAARTDDRNEYRFHINALPLFKEFLGIRNITDNLYTTVTLPVPVGVEVKMTPADKWKLRDEQIPIYDYLVNLSPPRAKFVGLQTGGGKTLISVLAAAKLGKRIVAIVRPMYMAKWTSDFKEILNFKKKDIFEIRGSDQLKSVLDLATEKKLQAKVLIISNKTMQSYLKLYEELRTDMKEDGYACVPEDMYEHLGAGLRLVDEVHQDFHLQAKLDLYTNVEKSFSLSATLLNDDPFIRNMQNLLYPIHERCPVPALKKYIHAVAVLYHMRYGRHYKFKEYGTPTYSHMALEKSIMKTKEFMNSYFSLIRETMEFGFIKDYKKGNKFAIYCSTTDMCTELVEYLKKLYPKMDIRRYAPSIKDPYENLLDPDIRVTTVTGAGTAHDIKGLTGVLLTIALGSIQANIQVLGRLRFIADTEVKFFYLTCMDIPPHLKYHEQKMSMLNERAASVKVTLAQYPV